jgi:hypothetical protein
VSLTAIRADLDKESFKQIGWACPDLTVRYNRYCVTGDFILRYGLRYNVRDFFTCLLRSTCGSRSAAS